MIDFSKLEIRSHDESAYLNRVDHAEHTAREVASRDAKATKTITGTVKDIPEVRHKMDGSSGVLLRLMEDGKDQPLAVWIRQGDGDPAFAKFLDNHPSFESTDHRRGLDNPVNITARGHFPRPETVNGRKFWTFEAFDFSIDGGPSVRTAATTPRSPVHPRFSMDDYRANPLEFPPVIRHEDYGASIAAAAFIAARANDRLAEASDPFTRQEVMLAKASNAIADAWQRNAIGTPDQNKDSFDRSMKTLLDDPTIDWGALGRSAMMFSGLDKSLQFSSPTAAHTTGVFLMAQAGIKPTPPEGQNTKEEIWAAAERVGKRMEELKQVVFQTLENHQGGQPAPAYSDPIAASVAAATIKHAPKGPATEDFNRNNFATSMVEHGVDAHVIKLMDVHYSRARIYSAALKERPLAAPAAGGRGRSATASR